MLYSSLKGRVGSTRQSVSSSSLVKRSYVVRLSFSYAIPDKKQHFMCSQKLETATPQAIGHPSTPTPAMATNRTCDYASKKAYKLRSRKRVLFNVFTLIHYDCVMMSLSFVLCFPTLLQVLNNLFFNMSMAVPFLLLRYDLCVCCSLYDFTLLALWLHVWFHYHYGSLWFVYVCGLSVVTVYVFLSWFDDVHALFCVCVLFSSVWFQYILLHVHFNWCSNKTSRHPKMEPCMTQCSNHSKFRVQVYKTLNKFGDDISNIMIFADVLTSVLVLVSSIIKKIYIYIYYI